jgi:uncharacterized protein GlcG (DUF336 family)
MTTILFIASFGVAQTVEKKTLTLQGAEQVIAAAKAEAQALRAPGGVIAVVDDGGNLMALERLPARNIRITSPGATMTARHFIFVRKPACTGFGSTFRGSGRELTPGFLE